MATYIVTYSSKTQGNREIGTYEDYESALAAAREAGAIGEPQERGFPAQDGHVYDVELDDDDTDEVGIWIERVR